MFSKAALYRDILYRLRHKELCIREYNTQSLKKVSYSAWQKCVRVGFHLSRKNPLTVLRPFDFMWTVSGWSQHSGKKGCCHPGYHWSSQHVLSSPSCRSSSSSASSITWISSAWGKDEISVSSLTPSALFFSSSSIAFFHILWFSLRWCISWQNIRLPFLLWASVKL